MHGLHFEITKIPSTLHYYLLPEMLRAELEAQRYSKCAHVVYCSAEFVASLLSLLFVLLVWSPDEHRDCHRPANL